MVWKWGAGYVGVSSTDRMFLHLHSTLQCVELPTYMYA